MSRYYANYGQYLGAQRCCDFRGQGPTGPSAIGQRGFTGPKGDTGHTGPTGPVSTSVSMLGGVASISGPTRGLTGYFGAYIAGTTLDVTTTEANARTVIPYDCIVSNFYVYSSNPLSAGTGYQFTIRKNSSDTLVTLAINSASQNASDTTNNALFLAGDVLTISSKPSNIPTGTVIRWTCQLSSN